MNVQAEGNFSRSLPSFLAVLCSTHFVVAYHTCLQSFRALPLSNWCQKCQTTNTFQNDVKRDKGGNPSGWSSNNVTKEGFEQIANIF
ncbi:hypothetical protein Y032_0618g715 [Ancylostoma ceylanicum]|uniref:Uncharacterized protein n=1 Tax=Ancylostoma ceylanicum TaxID=53326 RepID=A0A016WL38_9BILA|nr:hypothetical protein Y032_0618g715 [Ancylostoma ceylanicum]